MSNLGSAREWGRRLWRGYPETADPSRARRLYALVILGAVMALASVDRNILSILLIPIKREIGASDTAMGLLTGTAFGLVYATAAIPISRIADKGNRRTLLAAALGIWSVATAFCGLATSYVHLLLGRVGVAGAEAAANPSIMSMIADLYPPGRRAMAAGATLIGTGVGVLLGSAFGGYLAQAFGWRVAFAVVGLPGVFVALLIWLTVPEPVREVTGGRSGELNALSTWRTLQHLWKMRTFVFIVLAKSCLQIPTQATVIWMPTFLVRVYGTSLPRAGLYYGVATAAAAVAAAFVSGYVGDRLARRGPVWYLRVCVLSMVLTAPSLALITFAPTALWAFGLIFVYAFNSSLNNPPALAAALTIAPQRMRGMMIAIINFCTNLVGAGLGGLIIGALNDAWAKRYGLMAIRYSMLTMPLFLLAAGVLFYIASRTMNADARNTLADEADSAAA